MTSNKETRPEKKAILGEIRDHLTDGLFVVLTEHRGMSVTQTETLRGKLRQKDARFHVVKNRIFREAARGLEYERLSGALVGPTAMVVGKTDLVEVAKVLRQFTKENELPVIKMGSMQGVIFAAEDIEKLAILPSRPELLGIVLGTLAAPMTQVVSVLNQKLSSLLYVLKAIERKKS